MLHAAIAKQPGYVVVNPVTNEQVAFFHDHEQERALDFARERVLLHERYGTSVVRDVYHGPTGQHVYRAELHPMRDSALLNKKSKERN